MSRHPTLAGLLFLVPALVLAADTPPEASATTEIRFSELSRKVVNRGDHKITFVRVRPPVLPAPPPPPPVRKPTAEEIATAKRMEKKAYATLNVTATVYIYNNRTVSELTWRNEETGNHEYRAYSNADFRYLTQLHHLESETTVYSWFPFVSEYDFRNLPADEEAPRLPDLVFSGKEAEYFVDSRAKSVETEEATLAGLDYLHAFYQLNYAALKQDYEKRMAEHEAYEKELRENPPVKPDTVMHFWPIKSGIKSR
jgi:hypothetical protein